MVQRDETLRRLEALADPRAVAGMALNLSLLADSYAICRLAPEQEVPSWALRDRQLLSITYTAEELSIVCTCSSVPAEVRCDRGWAAIRVEGPLDLSAAGILASLAAPLAEGGVAIFAVSTFDTDYLLVKEAHLPLARRLLESAGHSFE